MLKDLKVSCSPHISAQLSTRRIMGDVIIALIPAMVAAGYFFRLHALLLIGVCVVSCLLAEWICNKIRKKDNSLDDLSAVVTGIILAFSLPPSLPIWVAVVGSFFAIAICKAVFGGLGANIFNPAMAARTFLTASFGILMTTWIAPATLPVIEKGIRVDTVTASTPLAYSKEAIKNKAKAKEYDEKLTSAFLGDVGGCLGETSSLAILIGAAYLLFRKTITIHIPAAVLIFAFLFSGVFYLINPDAYISPLLHLNSGGLMLCAFFIATDPVTAPLSKSGMWIFGAGVGILIMLIRIIGGYPEGIMYAILLMNAVTPLIDRLCKLVPAGGKPNVSK